MRRTGHFMGLVESLLPPSAPSLKMYFSQPHQLAQNSKGKSLPFELCPLYAQPCSKISYVTKVIIQWMIDFSGELMRLATFT